MKMQVVRTPSGAFIFINNWGRNGTNGMFQTKTFGNEADAKKAMEQKFRSKTGKTFANRNSADTANSSARGGHGHYEMVKRLQAAGAGFSTKKGSIAISLMWDHSREDRRNDLDLWVTTPTGERIGYNIGY